MMMIKIQIKNMVCPRCLNSVRNILIDLQIPYNNIQLGEVTLASILQKEKKKQLAEKLKVVGFELLDDKESKIINSIKAYLIEMIHYEKHQNHQNISVVLSQHLNMDYSSLSKIFSKMEGLTIEKYIIYQKVERIKELLSYNEMTISEIAFQMNYSSSAHLSNQFKKVTGLTPSQFKKNNIANRKTLDEI
ncbi:MAG: helix-turn-helix domain-containing protein [Chitinophagales bacterium]